MSGCGLLKPKLDLVAHKQVRHELACKKCREDRSRIEQTTKAVVTMAVDYSRCWIRGENQTAESQMDERVTCLPRVSTPASSLAG